MADLAQTDVVIVGGGWSGLLMAKEIVTRTSLSVVVLERGGPSHAPFEYAAQMDELDYHARFRGQQNIADVTVTHRHSSRGHAVPVRQYGSFTPCSGVGGNGERWAAMVSRNRPEAFTLATHLREKYGAARLPENLAVQDWGFTYDEIEPYYWRAEQMLGVSGKAGNINGRLIPGGNIFEGPRSHEFPCTPHPTTYAGSLFAKAALDLGYHPYPSPGATLRETYRDPDGVTRPGCPYCGYCTNYGCMIGAKAQPSNTLLPLLAKNKNFTLRTGCWVRRVIHRNGNAEGVSYVDAAGKEMVQPADAVVLAAWSINSVRLLLMSSIGEPYDATTGKGTLGSNLTHQVRAFVQAFLDKPLNTFLGAGGLGVAIGDFAGDPPDADVASGVFRGGTIALNTSGEGALAGFGKVPAGETTSNWGSQWKKATLNWHDQVASVGGESMHFAYRQNYMDLDPNYTDKFGDPLLRLTLDWTDHERREAAMINRIQTALAKAMGAKALRVTELSHRYSVEEYQSTHIQGGAIMGDSPERSVVNPWLQHWRIPNLWVVGGSSFPQNEHAPTLTILATTYRAADAFVDRYLKRPAALL